MSEPVKVTERGAASYYDKQESDARARMAELSQMTAKQIARACNEHYQREYESWQEYRDKIANLRARYEAMIERVEDWTPDPLVGFAKEHAIRYLRESIKFDCSYTGRKPVGLEPEKWFHKEMADALKSLERAQEHRAEDLARNTDRNRHIEAFLRSLPPESVAA